MIFTELPKLIAHLKDRGEVLWAPDPGSSAMFAAPAEAKETGYSIRNWKPTDAAHVGLYRAVAKRADQNVADDEGLVAEKGPVVSQELYEELNAQIREDTSDVRRLSTRRIDRCFVFVDVSDFSKFGSGIQMLVVLSLVRLARESIQENATLEAELCIGDGYVYVFKDSVKGTQFAAQLAKRIERAVALSAGPDFHFRIGVHVGWVRWFWDPGRQNWNYVGQGINGGQRVLSAIGKDVDDVVFVSAEVRQRIASCDQQSLLRYLDNKGRKADKHGLHWRVYQLNHSAIE